MSAFHVCAWLVRDTFRQSLATGVCWLMLGVTTLCALLCLTVSVVPGHATGGRHPDAPPELSEPVRLEATACAAELVPGCAGRATGSWTLPPAVLSAASRSVAIQRWPDRDAPWTRVSVAFGALELDLRGDEAQAVRTLELQLASWVADTAGLLLVLLWTAGFLPGFLEPASVSVLLAKPTSRGALLLGKFAGVLVFVALQATLFLAGTWLALALRTGVWDGRYFVSLPLLLLHFAVFFSFSAMLAVATRSTVASVFGTVLFWLLCWAMNLGRHTALSITDLPTPPGFGKTVEVAYWVLPKPLDFHVLLLHTLEADNLFAGLFDLQILAQRGAWLPGHLCWSLAASLTTACVLLAIAVYDFGTAEY